MKNSIIFFVLALLFVTVSCIGGKGTADNGTQDIVFCISMELLKKPVDSIRMDPLQIDSLAINKDCLDVYVSYGGGCGEVKFNMFYNNIVAQSFPPQTTIYLEFEDNDHCRAIEKKKISFNLEHFKAFAENGGIWLNLANDKEARILYNIVK